MTAPPSVRPTQAQPPCRILLAASEAPALPRLERTFGSAPVSITLARGFGDAARLAEAGAFAALVVDDSGAPVAAARLCAHVGACAPGTARVLITDCERLARSAHAVSLGELEGTLARPADPDLLREQVAHLVVNRARGTGTGIGTDLDPDTAAAVTALCRGLEARDPATREHGERVARATRHMGERMALAAREVDRLELAARVHDVGKLGVPDNVLHKPAALDASESAAVRRHAPIGAEILSSLPHMDDVVRLVRHHHEWYDGSRFGYPDRLAGNAIPLGSRIISCADTLDAMTSDRPYRPAQSVAVAAAEIERCSGSQLDPWPAAVLLELLAESGAALLEEPKADVGARP